MYHPDGVEKLHPVGLNGTGFCSKVTVKVAVGSAGGVGVGDDDELPPQATCAANAVAMMSTRIAPRRFIGRGPTTGRCGV